ncbi:MULTISPECIES: phage terminase large subunit family protein [Hyphobacterium]|uniref:Terminase large subunit gp17-like C-terminal domain-containing protein n=1 Tax=Hyphobacterium vulgare TaxID=1736751 RepID=A0ABV6ZVF5_9PROT
MPIEASKAAVYAAARTDFKSFVRLAFRWVHPGVPFADNFHIDALCFELERVRSGETRRLAINLPPRTLKSFIVSVAWPAFLLGQDPSKKVFVVSHNESLALEHAVRFRALMDHPELKTVFPTLKPQPTKNAEFQFTTSKLGGRTSLTTFAGVTGMGADVIILDDPISALDAASEKACNKVAHWIKHTLSTRFNNMATGVMICVMQRLSIWDPHSQLTQTGKWRKLILSAKATATVNVQTGPDIHHEWKKGELLHPARLPQFVLDETAQDLGAHHYQAQFMQAPLPAGGGLIDVNKFRTYSGFPRKTADSHLISVDSAGGGPTAKSYSVIMVFAVFDGHLYLRYVWRKRADFVELRSQTMNAINRFRPADVLIEKASTGIALAAEVHNLLQKHQSDGTGWGARLHPVNPTISKEARWAQASLLIAQGRLHIPAPNEMSWVDPFVNECRTFPEGANDDQVDALSQALYGYRRLYDLVGESKVTLIPMG